MIKRVTIFVMDSIGIGELPDSEEFGDKGCNTLGHIAEQAKNFNIPNLIELGIGNIEGVNAIKGSENVKGAYGRSMELSDGKDTTTGHWEMAGLHIDEPFKTFPNGFPDHIIKEFEEKTGRKVICNKPASGTVILEELGEAHVKSGDLIVYTSADSVFQIAAHEDVVPIEEQYRNCEIAREILMGPYAVARVIARPFIGEVGKFERTSNRRDYSLSPFNKTVLDIAKESGLEVRAVGKIVDIFNGQGITKDVHTKDNMDGVDWTIKWLKEDFEGILFTNLVDFDAKFGHRRNVQGYGDAIVEMDKRIPEILDAMKDDDIIIFTADHGNDPAYKGTDHTREYIPILVYGKSIKDGVNIGTRKTFADIAATVSDILNIEKTPHGESFKNIILK